MRSPKSSYKIYIISILTIEPQIKKQPEKDGNNGFKKKIIIYSLDGDLDAVPAEKANIIDSDRRRRRR